MHLLQIKLSAEATIPYLLKQGFIEIQELVLLLVGVRISLLREISR